MSETIFFGYWSGVNKAGKETRHDRIEIFKEDKSLRDFFNWLEVKRNLIELENSTEVVLINCKLLNSEQNDAVSDTSKAE